MKRFKYLLIPVVILAACKPAVKNTAETTALPLSGTWKMISAVTITKGDSVRTYPVKGVEMIKIINDTHFAFLQHDIKDSGIKPVYNSGAGTYKLDGDNYTENLQYCNYREWENRSFNFKISIRHDTLVQKGIEKIDSLNINHEIVETYVRIKKQNSMSISQKESLIKDYIRAYNNFDIDGMLKGLHPAVIFKNISGGKVDLSINGLNPFKEQAEKAAAFFKSREQTIKAIKHHDDETEIEISYHAVLAVDMPNGLKKGDQLNLTGRSVFKFADGKIAAITDIS